MDASTIAEYDAHRTFHRKPFRSACYAGYTSMVFDSIGRVRICCGNSEYVLGDIREERLDDIWNGPRLSRIRDALNAYDLSLGCAVCRHKIAAGIMKESTLRTTQLIAQKFEDFPVEAEAPYWPKHLEFHLSNRCNLACVTCFGEFSSTIRALRDKLPAYPRAYDDQFFEDLRKYLPRLEAAQFLGGEPFLIPEMYRVWDMLIEEQLTPQCHVTTNGTVFNAKVERVLDELPMSVSVSMDGVTAATFEAIRVNADFTRVIANMRRFKEHCRSRDRYIGINFTLSRLNWHEFVDFLLFAESEDVDVSASEVYFPEHLSLFTMTADEVRRVTDTLEQQVDNASHLLRRNRQLVDNRIKELRHFLIDAGPANAVFAVTQREQSTASGPSLVKPFLGTIAPAGSMSDLHALARHRLEQWQTSGSIFELTTDVDDVILQVSCAPDSTLPWSTDFIRKPLGEWVNFVVTQLGQVVIPVSTDKQPHYLDQTFRLEREGVARTLLRIITIPCYDDSGVLTGVRAQIAATQVDLLANDAPQQLEHA